MLNRLENNRTQYGIQFILFSLLLCAGGYVLMPGSALRFLWPILAGGNALLAILYKVRGLARGLRWGLSWILFWAALALDQFFVHSGILPAAVNPNTVTLFVLMPLMLTLPKLLEDRIRLKLTGESERTAVQIFEEQQGYKNRSGGAVDFETHQQYKALARSFQDPRSIHELSRPARILRMAAGILTALTGIGCIVAGGILTDSPNPELILLSPWLVGAGFGLLITAFVLLDQGFRQGGLVFFGFFLFIGLCYGAYLILNSALRTSFPLFLLLSLLFAVFLTAAFLLARRYFSRRSATFIDFEQDGILHWVDLYLKDTSPILNYDCLCRMTGKAISDETALDEFHQELLLFAQPRQIILAGSLQNKAEDHLVTYLYCSRDRQVRALDRWAAKKSRDAISIEIVRDESWQFFQELLPSEKTMIRLNNEWIVADLADQDLDLRQPQPMIFTAAFRRMDQAQAFLEMIRTHPDAQAVYEDYSQVVLDEELDEIYSHLVHVMKRFRISQAWLDIETLKFLEMTQSFGGSFENIALGELSNDPSGE